ncbi:hypothetical protein AM461_06215 [Providencia rettgeri]|nr:hypothetical protein AM461_06215 [Providencia rettgeri]
MPEAIIIMFYFCYISFLSYKFAIYFCDLLQLEINVTHCYLRVIFVVDCWFLLNMWVIEGYQY